MKIIAGLGNPTAQYQGTRHNMGFMVIDRLSAANRIAVETKKFKALIGSGFIGGEKVLLMKPQTYMNLSGESIQAAMAYYHLLPEELIVICDDINLPPGQLRIRTGGSAGGHNGLKNIILQCGSDRFPRIRIGVGEKPSGMDLADYVLGHVGGEERQAIAEGLDDAAKAAELMIKEGADAAMNLYNRRKHLR